MYSSSEGTVIRESGFRYSGFADDGNSRKRFSLVFQYNTLKFEIAECMERITRRMHIRKLKINPQKTEIALFHPKHIKERILINGTFIGNQCVRFTDVVKNVGVLLDNEVTRNRQVNSVVSHSYKLLKDIGSVRNLLSKEQTATLVHSVITARIDYCNSLYINLDTANIQKLEKLQNSAARLVERRNKRESARPILYPLHWLNIKTRIAFKVMLLTYKYVVGKSSSSFDVSFKSHNCRPIDFLKLNLLYANTQYGKRTFKYCAPRLRNELPLELRTASTIDKFKKDLKTFLFKNNTFVKKSLNW